MSETRNVDLHLDLDEVTAAGQVALAALADPERPPCFPARVNADWSSTYPLAGERLGPAWRAMWRVLCSPGWHGQGELKVAADAALDALGLVPLSRYTIANLLAGARRFGMVAVRPVRGGGAVGGTRRIANQFRAGR